MEETSTVAVESGYHEIAATENLSLDSDPIAVQPNQVYEAKAWVVGFEGSPGCALVALVFLDESGKEVGRETALIDDFSGRAKQYKIQAELPAQARQAIVGYRVNRELPTESRCASTKIWLEATGSLAVSRVRGNGQTCEAMDLISQEVTMSQQPIVVPPLEDFVGSFDKIECVSTASESYLEVAGWVASRDRGAPVDTAKLYLDDMVLGTTEIGIARPDVASATRQEFLLSGWNGRFSLPPLQPGYHLVELHVGAGPQHEPLALQRQVISVKENGTIDIVGRRPSAPLRVPPPELIHMVAGSTSEEWFLRGGALAACSIQKVLSSADRRLDDLEAILDFGCGSGRIVRHLHGHKARIHGSDYNPVLVKWCQDNLGFAEFKTNDTWPPLAYDDESFDLIYAFSVFTHMIVSQQQAWLEELSRVLRPGGLLLFSTHGPRYLRVLFNEDKERFAAGEIVVIKPDVLGTNDCMAYHPPQAIQGLLPGKLSLLSFLPEGAIGNPYQDASLVMKVAR